MCKKLDLDDFVLLGRTMDEYFNMFNLNDELLEKCKILDVGSGVSSFCAEANARGFDVTASDKIYVFSPQAIEAKCGCDLEDVISQLPGIADLYRWNYFKDIESLKLSRQRAATAFIKDFKQFGNERYIPTDYPASNFEDKQFTLALVSHFLFLYDEHISIQLHKEILTELIRITSGQIRIFPLANLKGQRSLFVDTIRREPEFGDVKIDIEKVNYEFIKGGNEMMVIRIDK